MLRFAPNLLQTSFRHCDPSILRQDGVALCYYKDCFAEPRNDFTTY